MKEAKAEQLQQRDMVNDAERVRSSLSRRILSMQVINRTGANNEQPRLGG